MIPPLWIIPARIGSVRIPQKNFRLLAGCSLLERAIRCVRQADPHGELVVSTNQQNKPSALLAPDLGVTWVWQRSCETMVGVVLDVLGGMPGPSDQCVILVQPTQPLRLSRHLVLALELLRGGKRSVVSMTETVSCDKAYRISQGGRLDPVGVGVERDQDARPTYRCDGTFYGFHRGWFLEHQSFRHPETYAVVIPPGDTCALDTPHDWHIAELLLADQARLAAESDR